MFSNSPFTLFLLIINVLVSGYALYFDRNLIDKLAFKPHRVLKEREFYRLVSGGFVHGSMGHLLFNMATLFFFGPVLEARLGSALFLIIFFGAELSAHLLATWMHRDSVSYSAVGASGAISGVLFSYSLFFPLRKIYLFLIPIGIPAWIFATGFVVFSAVAMRRKGDTRGGGIAHEAHLGGALGGLILTLIVEPSSLELFLTQLGF